MKNLEIREVMKLTHITIRDLSGNMHISSDYVGRLLRQDMTDKDRSRILKSLDELIALRKEDFDKALELRARCCGK